MKEMEQRMFEMEQVLLTSEHPSTYFNRLLGEEWFHEPPFSYLYQLKFTEQSPIHHPEGDVWTHTMLVINEAAKQRIRSDNPRAFMWAALLHDIGKAPTTRFRKGHITSYDHDKEGEKLARDFLRYYTEDETFINQVCALVRWHMMILYVTKKLNFGNKERMKKEANIADLGLLGYCDRMGRLNVNEDEIRKIIDKFYQNIV